MTTTAEINTVTLVERKRADLRDAIASGNERKIDRCARALEAAREQADRESLRQKDRAAAEIAASEQKRAEFRAERERRADEVEDSLREHEPFAEIHANGKVIIIRLAHEESNGRGVAIECVRRVVYAATHRFQESIVASRSAGAPVAEADWLKLLTGSDAGTRYAERLGLVTITDEQKS